MAAPLAGEPHCQCGDDGEAAVEDLPSDWTQHGTCEVRYPADAKSRDGWSGVPAGRVGWLRGTGVSPREVGQEVRLLWQEGYSAPSRAYPLQSEGRLQSSFQSLLSL